MRLFARCKRDPLYSVCLFRATLFGSLQIYSCFNFYRKLGDGLFLECCRRVSQEYPDIEFEGMIVDNCSMQVVKIP